MPTVIFSDKRHGDKKKNFLQAISEVMKLTRCLFSSSSLKAFLLIISSSLKLFSSFFRESLNSSDISLLTWSNTFRSSSTKWHLEIKRSGFVDFAPSTLYHITWSIRRKCGRKGFKNLSICWLIKSVNELYQLCLEKNPDITDISSIYIFRDS